MNDLRGNLVESNITNKHKNINENRLSQRHSKLNHFFNSPRYTLGKNEKDNAHGKDATVKKGGARTKSKRRVYCLYWQPPLTIFAFDLETIS